MDPPVDETSPLLGRSSDDDATLPKKTPLPRLQLGVLMLVHVAEPMTAYCIFPFINQVRTGAFQLRAS